MGLPPKITCKEDLGKFQSEIQLCPDCITIIRARKDVPHGVVICEGCGFILGEVLVDYPPESNKPIYSFKECEDMSEVTINSVPNCSVSDRELLAECNTTSYPEGKDKPQKNKQFKGIAKLLKQYDKQVTNADEKRAYRLNKYTEYVGVVNTNFMMSKYQKSRAKHIIYKVGNFKKVCKNCKYEVMVTAICIYIMRRDGRKIKIPTNRFCRSIGLTQNKYTLIIENLLSLKI